MKIIPNNNGCTYVDGIATAFIAGQEIDIKDSKAKTLIKAGLARAVTAAAPTKRASHHPSEHDSGAKKVDSAPENK